MTIDVLNAPAAKLRPVRNVKRHARDTRGRPLRAPDIARTPRSSSSPARGRIAGRRDALRRVRERQRGRVFELLHRET
jgi:hypothetical protein